MGETTNNWLLRRVVYTLVGVGIASWVGWVSAAMLYGSGLTPLQVQKLMSLADRVTRLELLYPLGDAGIKRTSNAIEDNTAQIVVLRKGQELIRLDLKGQEKDLQYIITTVDDIRQDQKGGTP